jgi:hypothetical protein
MFNYKSINLHQNKGNLEYQFLHNSTATTIHETKYAAFYWVSLLKETEIHVPLHKVVS